MMEDKSFHLWSAFDCACLTIPQLLYRGNVNLTFKCPSHDLLEARAVGINEDKSACHLIASSRSASFRVLLSMNTLNSPFHHAYGAFPAQLNSTTPIHPALATIDIPTYPLNFTPAPSSSQPRAPTTAKKRKRSNKNKNKNPTLLEMEANWSFSEFLFYVFEENGRRGIEVHRTLSHANTVQKFLSSHCKHFPVQILQSWWHHRDGRLARNSDLMYSTTTPFHEIKPVHPAISSFAVQLVKSKVVKDAASAVEPHGGLHATTSDKSSRKANWVDIRAMTVPAVSDILKKSQPIAWYLITSIAANRPRIREGNVAIRQNRPIDAVCTHILATLAFARNQQARLLQIAKGILFFALSAPADLFAYESRIGNMPTYSSIYNALCSLAFQEANNTWEIGRDPSKWGILHLDNVQQYIRQQDLRIGRKNTMNIGIAATYFETEGYPPMAPDINNKRARIAENKRKDLTVEQVLGWVDHEHLEMVGVLHWLCTLTEYIPELSHYKSDHHIKVSATKVHPLATSGKNETVTTELKDALKYLQNHIHPFESFSFLQPVLESWHTEATNLSRVYETHWGRPLSVDPSTLGHSARIIGRAAPSNMKKVDYYPSAQLLFLILDVRQLDCWRLALGTDDIFAYFQKLKDNVTLPPFKELEAIARKLYRAYTSSRAQYRALSYANSQNPWSKIIPRGSTWVPHLQDMSTNGIGISETSNIGSHSGLKSNKKPKQKKGPTADDSDQEESFKGDCVLSQSIAFMQDAMISRECAYAIADGDFGRLYECLKVMLFTFAGSSHTKYATYLLEFLTDLELEPSPDLKQGVLNSMLVNLSGKEGAFSAGDIIQEFYNRLLEAIIERKGAEFGAPFIRDTISHNLHHMGCIKTELREGISLSKKSGKHSDPHMRPEVKMLMQSYAHHELHSRRPGRIIDNNDKLKSGKLQKWVTETTRARAVGSASTSSESSAVPVGGNLDESDDEVEEEPGDAPTLGSMQFVNGGFIIETFGTEETIADFISLLRPDDEGLNTEPQESDFDFEGDDEDDGVAIPDLD
ncbi:hypothetical protein BYT27DRAFT_7221584 [Phlegmacium glaucopus]|nr:hypothetical protein BYT27DRAFT_7221584 [Phlegmacium glaucopus]